MSWRLRGEGESSDCGLYRYPLHQMENAADDPREFAYGDDGDLDVRSGLDALLSMSPVRTFCVFCDFRSAALQGVSERANRSGSRQRPEGDGVSSKQHLVQVIFPTHLCRAPG
jgi:hypothetical protein